ncbi:hypothetical protein SNEBB_010241 [Seison nebaliae]|nr:hypothetical protein SNEBB_010241 [Seison nebaliae]
MTFNRLLMAVDFAASKHRLQKRKDNETPYINHPIGVANILSNETGITDEATLIAALLHDTIEDTDTTFDEIDRLFGREISNIVQEVTDDKSLAKEERKLQQIKKAATVSPKARLVKMADKIYNLRDLNRRIPIGWNELRVAQYFEWAEKVWRNGLKGNNEQLDDILSQLFRQFEEKKKLP